MIFVWFSSAILYVWIGLVLLYLMIRVEKPKDMEAYVREVLFTIIVWPVSLLVVACCLIGALISDALRSICYSIVKIKDFFIAFAARKICCFMEKYK